MKKIIHEYVNSKNSILKKFGCEEEFPIKILINRRWMISGDEGIFFLTYWNENNEKIDFAIAKKDGEPMIYRNKDYSMIIAIDCIKIAIVYKNTNMM